MSPLLMSLLFSHYAMSDSLWSHGLQHARLPCPLSPGVYSNWYPLIQSSHPTISCFFPFSSCQSFPASGSFPMSQLFTSGGQSIDVNFLKYLKIFHLKMFSPTKQWLNSLYYHLSSISLFNKTGFQFNI